MSIEVMKQALEALEFYRSGEDYQPTPASEAMPLLRQAIEQAEKDTDWEAVAADQAMTIAMMKDDIQRLNMAMETKLCVRGYEIQIADLENALREKRQWVGLTDKEMADCWSQTKEDPLFLRLIPFSRSIEAKLKEKNT